MRISPDKIFLLFFHNNKTMGHYKNEYVTSRQKPLLASVSDHYLIKVCLINLGPVPYIRTLHKFPFKIKILFIYVTLHHVNLELYLV